MKCLLEMKIFYLFSTQFHYWSEQTVNTGLVWENKLKYLNFVRVLYIFIAIVSLFVDNQGHQV